MMGKLAEIDFDYNFIAFGTLSVVASALMMCARAVAWCSMAHG